MYSEYRELKGIREAPELCGIQSPKHFVYWDTCRRQPLDLLVGSREDANTFERGYIGIIIPSFPTKNQQVDPKHFTLLAGSA